MCCSTDISDELRERYRVWRRNPLLTQVRHSLDLIGAVVIVGGLGVGVLGCMRIVSALQSPAF
jgi:hypothetical protein